MKLSLRGVELSSRPPAMVMSPMEAADANMTIHGTDLSCAAPLRVSLQLPSHRAPRAPRERPPLAVAQPRANMETKGGGGAQEQEHEEDEDVRQDDEGEQAAAKRRRGGEGVTAFASPRDTGTWK